MISSTNISWHSATVTRGQREKLNGHKAVVVWFTGLSGAGKSTLAHAVEENLHRMGCRTFVLDGDNVRHGLSSDLGFSADDRRENVRRIGEVSKLMMDSGLIVITAFISPFLNDRESVRNLLPHGSFLEFYCNASLDICEDRDLKGLYKKARAGEIKDFTGVNSPYEEPINPELTVSTGSESLLVCVDHVLQLLRERQIIHAIYN